MQNQRAFPLNHWYSPIQPAWPPEGIFIFALAQNLKSFGWRVKSTALFLERGKMGHQIQPGG
jgi:hypothetical protein